MAYQRFLIAPLSEGLTTNVKPWLIPDSAWAKLRNAYLFRGRVRKRFGSYLMGGLLYGDQTNSRLRVNLGNTNGSGNISVTVPGAVFAPGQQFSVGTETLTVTVNGTPGTLITNGPSTVHTYNTTNGALVINGAAASTAVYFYPGTPVMGLANYESGPVNNQPSYGFDTQFAYVFSGGSWTRSGTIVWHGSDSQFFQVANWEGTASNLVYMFVTNFNASLGALRPVAADDPIYYFDGSSWGNFSAFTIFNSAGAFVQTARIIVAFKNRLILLNTVENDNSAATGGLATGTATQYLGRARYSANASPFANGAWLNAGQTNGGNSAIGGGFIDATTEEAIISAEFIKDRLIVYFERSTWELVYTGNDALPFVWQKINTELGSEAQFSTVPFDKVILTIGNTGVHACNGANVERIDTKIPTEVFDIQDRYTGVQRVAGIRDYFAEMVYWSFPQAGNSQSATYPNRVLVYNYQNGAWAFNDDTITCFGYFEQSTGLTWENTNEPWVDGDFSWDSGAIQAQFRQVIAGNQQGFVSIIDVDTTTNAAVLQITNISASGSTLTLTIYNHNLVTNDWIYIYGDSQLDVINYQVIYVNANMVTIQGTYTGTYRGGSYVGRVSLINMWSKQWNPFDKEGRNVYLAKIDFLVDRTANGQVTVDYYPSASELSMIDEGEATGAILGNNILETTPYPTIPLEQVQDRLWHPVYFQSDGECIQIVISLSNTQMQDYFISGSDFQLHGLVLHVMPASSRLQ